MWAHFTYSHMITHFLKISSVTHANITQKFFISLNYYTFCRQLKQQHHPGLSYVAVLALHFEPAAFQLHLSATIMYNALQRDCFQSKLVYIVSCTIPNACYGYETHTTQEKPTLIAQFLSANFFTLVLMIAKRI